MDFAYLAPDHYYFDSACQTLRPQPVLDALMEYYTQYNACGGRVKYAWGRRVDEVVDRVREQAVRFVGKKPKEYTAVFTLNTTYGINLLLQQLDPQDFDTVHTGPWEHNSVHVPLFVWSQEHGKVFHVDAVDVGTRPLVVMQSTSNIDGSNTAGLPQLAKKIHKQKGLLIVDAAQTLGHGRQLLKDIDFDACVGSVHKMYGPSLGVIILKKSLLPRLLPRFVGGGTVLDVTETTVEFAQDATLLEPGLQDWAGIVGFGAAMEWMSAQKDLETREAQLGSMLYAGLQAMPEVHLYNHSPSSTVSFYTDKADSHRLALYLSEKHIMVRSGYFCCHRYLKHTRGLPPLLRFSLGAHNSSADVDMALTTLSQLLKNI